ncbi:MAG TPA: tripartite tricarboxylate transporter substrate binding protein [Burkholderiales bacterium]|nr:tripartite tricarboxylate transporter substrate binding protein [Burkholderiales bacterium]
MKALVALFLWAAVSLAAAQAYPSKPVRMIVPFPPGGTADVLARHLAARLSEGLGQTLVVDNRPGAAGNVASDLAAKAPNDGYTLFFGTIGTHGGINAALYPKLQFDAFRDFEPVALAHLLPNIVIVHPDNPAKTLPELLATLRKEPDKHTFASSGNGGISHLSGELLKQMSGIRMVHVPYKGGAAATADIMGGRVTLMIETAPNALGHARAGRLRALATTGTRRSAAAPELPTIAEAGRDFGLSGYEVTTWTALYVPAGTPKDIVQRLAAEMAKAAKAQDYIEKLAPLATDVPESSPEHLRSFMKSEFAKWAKVVKESGAKID